MTTSISLMLRLGLALTGSNTDLAPVPKPGDDDSQGGGDGQDDQDGDDTEDGDDGSGGSDEDADDDADGSGKGSDDSDEDGEDDGEGSGDGSEGDDTDDGDADGEGGESGDDEGEDEGDAPGEPGDGDTDGDGSGPDADGDGGDSDGGDDADSDQDGGEAGGHYEAGEDPASIAESMLEALENGEDSGLTDNNEALGDAIDGEATEDDVEDGETVWRPYNPDGDVVRTVKADARSRAAAGSMRKSVRAPTSFLRNKMRSKFLQARRPEVVHGVRKGSGLSDRRLVSSVVELRAGRRPTRPDWQRNHKEECTLVAGVVIDQSGSMGGLRVDAGRSAMCIADALDALGSPCLVVGPRNGGAGYSYTSHGYGSEDWYDADGNARFHRDDNVIVDVFKDWDESMSKAGDRFGKVQATGSTPLSDGIQYALQEISNRPERHRVILVITDGMPDNSAVVKRQIRIAAEAGIHVIGVGISSGCYAVKRLFPEHVAVHDVEALPKELLTILTGIMFPKGGKRAKLDGKFKKAR